jgi:hypothetical protein
MWVVGMLVSQMARWRVVNNYRFAHAKALRDFLYAAFLLEAYADVHSASGKYFVVFEFEPSDVERFLVTPLEGHDMVSSNWIPFANSNRIPFANDDSIGLAMSRAGSTWRDGFNLGMWPPGRLGKDRLFAASCIDDEFAMFSTLGDVTFLGMKHMYRDSPLIEAMRKGQALPFLLITIPATAGAP